MRGSAARNGDNTSRRRGQRLGKQFSHAPSRPSRRQRTESDRKDRSERVDKQESGNGEQRLRQAQKMLQPAAARTEVPRGTRTRLIASPSGMLWIAIATVISRPSVEPPPNAAPSRSLRPPSELSSRQRSGAPGARPRPAAIPACERGHGPNSARMPARRRSQARRRPPFATGCDRRPPMRESRTQQASRRLRPRSTPREPSTCRTNEDQRQRTEAGRQRRHQRSKKDRDDSRLHQEDTNPDQPVSLEEER